MMLAGAFADIALSISSVLGGPYHDAIAHWPGEPTTDDGGSIVSPGTPVAKSCSVQVDGVTEAMRSTDDYQDKDMRLLILAATLDGDMDTDAQIEVLAGPHVGTWMVASVNRDPAGVYWECRGRVA